MRFRPITRAWFILFVIACFILGWCGAEAPDDTAFGLKFVWWSRFATIYYFAFFLIILPIMGLVEKPKELPESITKSVLGGASE